MSKGTSGERGTWDKRRVDAKTGKEFKFSPPAPKLWQGHNGKEENCCQVDKDLGFGWASQVAPLEAVVQNSGGKSGLFFNNKIRFTFFLK